VLGADRVTESGKGAEAPDVGPTNGRADRSKRRLRGLLERVGLTPETASGTFYHGFISYSHAADGELAPAIQKGLQRFAKPWYRVRALHIFRDDASLSANPNLWGSIREALEASEHLILLASPRAAGSEWVAKEAAYWREHKSIDTILIGLTDGELIWQTNGAGDSDHMPDGDGSRNPRSALPTTLDGAFNEEPRFIDLRWAHNAADLSLSHPNWREVIAELAAPLHGKPKDELAGEEVRQHRRTLKVVRAVGTALVALTLIAVIAGVVAYSQYRSAQARALAAEATAALGTNPEHSLSLALQSTQINATSTGIQALRSALATAPQRMVINSGAGAGVRAAWSPVSSQIAITGPGEAVQLWNSRNGRLQHVLSVPGSSLIVQLTYSRDGRWLAAVTKAGGVYVWNAATLVPVDTASVNARVQTAYQERLTGGPFLIATWGASAPDGLIVYALDVNQVLVFDPVPATVRELVRLPRGTTGVDAAVPSPDGSRMFVAYETPDASLMGAGSVVDLKANRSVALTPTQPMFGHQACWFGDSGAFITWDSSEAQDLALRWYNGASGREVAEFPSPDTITAAGCSPSATQDWAATGERGGRVLLHVVTRTGGARR
jgi:Flp pilus assembly protein TadG